MYTRSIGVVGCVLAAPVEYGRYVNALRGARALTVPDYHDGWITVHKAVKGKTVTAPIRGTKTDRPKRLPVSDDLRNWIEQDVEGTGRLTAGSQVPRRNALLQVTHRPQLLGDGRVDPNVGFEHSVYRLRRGE
jgi:hypothetical protein